jgi:hypothetical protein
MRIFLKIIKMSILLHYFILYIPCNHAYTNLEILIMNVKWILLGNVVDLHGRLCGKEECLGKKV